MKPCTHSISPYREKLCHDRDEDRPTWKLGVVLPTLSRFVVSPVRGSSPHPMNGLPQASVRFCPWKPNVGPFAPHCGFFRLPPGPTQTSKPSSLTAYWSQGNAPSKSAHEVAYRVP